MQYTDEPQTLRIVISADGKDYWLSLNQMNCNLVKLQWYLFSIFADPNFNLNTKIIIEDNTISFKEEGTKITLGGIAKGYAVDEALEVLRGMGIKYALVDAGGDIGTLGSKPDGELWNVALVNPDDTSQSLANFRFSDKAVATSGNYERFFDPEKTAHHILNPKTGYSASGCISVTIIAESCTQADVLATGVFVMGPENGMELVELLDDVECLIVDADRAIHQS